MIDFSVKEKAKNVYVECVDFVWSDLGKWVSLKENSEKNEVGNATQNGLVKLYDSKNNMVSVKGDKLVVAVGINDYIIADSGDVLLICPKSEEQRIKLFVNDLKITHGDKYI